MTGASSEEWREVPGFDRWYDVSNLGNVRSWRDRQHAGVRRREPRALSGRHTDLGYHEVRITHPVFGDMNALVHQLVLAAFVAHRPRRKVCDHINSTPSDNRVENLRWVSQAKNTQHAAAEGHLRGRWTTRLGPRSFSPLNEDKVREIRRRRREGALLRELAKEFNASMTTVSQVANGLIWRDVTP